MRALMPFALLAGAAIALVSAAGRQPSDVTARENAYRSNNIGVSRLERFDFDSAAAAFRQALEADPKLAIARLNLGIALFYGGKAEEAQKEITAAKTDLPGKPQPDYMLGLIARGTGDTQAAIEAFSSVRRLDEDDAGTAINLGQLYRQERKFKEAVESFRRAMTAAPYNATAAYGLANTLVLAGQAEEGKAAMAHFQTLSASSYAITYSQTYLEQGRYAEAITSTGAEAPLVDTRVPDVTFVDATKLLPPQPGPAAGERQAGSVALVDLDGDNDLDVLEAGAGISHVYRNDGGRFADVTNELLGAVSSQAATGFLAGDYDNDGRRDLAVLGPSGVRLLHSEAKGFSDATTAAGLASLTGAVRTAAWLDADHDGDLDLIVAIEGATASTRLLRNNGDGRFVDVTKETGITSPRPAAAIVPTDYDNRRDIDVLVVTATGSPLLFRNLRDGTFQDVAGDVGLALDSGAAMAAIGDFNKDGYQDLFFPRANAAGIFATTDGRGRYVTAPAPAGTADARAAQFIDYDSDGLLDLLVLTGKGPRLLRNLGREWSDVTGRAMDAAAVAALTAATSFATGDLDGDGRADIVARGPSGLTVWRAGGGGTKRAIGVRLTSRVSNRSAVGAKIEMRAGSLRQQLETYAAIPQPAEADLLFALGDRAGADVVRVLWPSGILQAEIGAEAAGKTAAGPVALLPPGAMAIEELDRKPSSCPFLYTWNGERFTFITDFLGGGEMGYWLAPGERNTPDPDEYVRIDGEHLKPRNGRYELRITNELEESLFLDRAQLVVVSHPQGIEIHPNEGLVPKPGPFALFSAERPQSPLAASDDKGHDLLAALAHVDRRYADGFALERIRGYAADHTLNLTLPSPGAAGRRLLLLTGWTDYAFSGDNVAAHQAGLTLRPPQLEYKDAAGRWHTAIEDIGMPVGRPQTVVVDLQQTVPAAARDIRITTTMRIYWDRALVDVSDGKAAFTVTRLEAATADLHWRGYSNITSSDGGEPYSYDYDRVSSLAPWKLLPGRYTREGDVKPLLTATDDMFVVSRPGDEIALSFDAAALPPLPDGWTRTFLLYADGFSKEMNLHSASPDGLLPLPFHGMTRYPYSSPEAYPSTPAHREYLERYNTRVVSRALPALEAQIDPAAARTAQR